MIEIALKGKPNIGGLGRVSYKIAESLKKLGFEVKLHALDIRIPTYYLSDLYFSYILSKKLTNRSVLIGWMGQNYFSCRSHEGRYFTQCGDIRPYMKGLALEFTSGRERIHEMFNDITYGIYDLHKYELIHSDRIIVPSNFVKQQLDWYDQNLKEKAVIYPHGVDNELFDHQRDKSDYVLFVGGVSRRKGILNVFKAIKLLKRRGKDIKLVLVGCGKWESLAKLSGRYGIKENIEFKGFVPDRTLYNLFTKASCLVLPSYSDGFGIPVIEAIAIGVPVIVSENTGSKDIVRESKGGFVIEPGNVTQLVSSLSTLLENSELNWRMGENARETIKKKYTWMDVTKRFVRDIDLEGAV